MSTFGTTIKQVPHIPAGAGAAGLSLALEVAHDLHAPAGRAPEVATPAPASLGTARRTKARNRHHTPSRAA
jgi:hypothetical protein